jgi:hypothetical protein
MRDPNGSVKVFCYSHEVVKQCLEQIEILDAKDPVWCDSYVKLLINAVRFNGPHEAAFWCLSHAINRLALKTRFDELPDLVDMAASELSATPETIPADYVHRMGVVVQLCAEQVAMRSDHDLAESLHQKVANLVKGRDPRIEGGSLLALGILHVRQSRGDEARPILSKACELLKACGDDENLATALMEVGILDLDAEEWESAQNNLEAAEAIYRRFEAPNHLTGLPHCLSNLVEVDLHRGVKDIDSVNKRLEEAIQLARSRKDEDLEAILLRQKRQTSGRNPEMDWWY